METEHVFSALLSELHPIIDWVRAQLQGIGLDPANMHKVELALEEAVVNIMNHGYKGKSGQIVVQIRQTKGREARITLRDQAPPFNPVEYKHSFDPLSPLEKREVGGLGIFLMRQYMDDIHYVREGNSNVLTLTKQIRR